MTDHAASPSAAPLPRRIRDVKLSEYDLSSADQSALEALHVRLNDGRGELYQALVSTLDDAQGEALRALLDRESVQSYITGLRRASRSLRAQLGDQQRRVSALERQLHQQQDDLRALRAGQVPHVEPVKFQRALPHEAVVHLTGWLSAEGEHWRVNGTPFRWQDVDETLLGTRVHVSAAPYTDAFGKLKLRAFKVQPARKANHTYFKLVGTLARVDPSEGLIRVWLYPQYAAAQPRSVTALATAGVLRSTDPEWFSVRVTGRICQGQLLADVAERVHAPRPVRWEGWRNRRKAHSRPPAEDVTPDAEAPEDVDVPLAGPGQ